MEQPPGLAVHGVHDRRQNLGRAQEMPAWQCGGRAASPGRAQKPNPKPSFEITAVSARSSDRRARHGARRASRRCAATAIRSAGTPAKIGDVHRPRRTMSALRAIDQPASAPTRDHEQALARELRRRRPAASRRAPAARRSRSSAATPCRRPRRRCRSPRARSSIGPSTANIRAGMRRKSRLVSTWAVSVRRCRRAARDRARARCCARADATAVSLPDAGAQVHLADRASGRRGTRNR